jgi:ATP-dependent DNA ligase
MALILIHPSRCTSSLPDDLSKPYLIAEEKLDGSRYVLYIGGDPYNRRHGNTLLSKRPSSSDGKLVDRTENVPHITGIQYDGLEDTILDGEIMASDFLGTNSVMNSSPALAVSKQGSTGKLRYNVFDVLVFRGKDVRGLALEQRRKILVEVIKRMGNEFVTAIPQFTGDIQAYFNEIVARGGEGVIVKDIRNGYGVGWCKMKKAYDISCIISGWKPGNGKYASSIGSIALSVLHDGKLVEIGFASGFDDSLRNEMAKDFKKFEGRVVDVFAQEIQDSKRSGGNPVGRLRHPTFHRLRDDMNSSDCTSEKLWTDFKATKTKNNRWRTRD